MHTAWSVWSLCLTIPNSNSKVYSWQSTLWTFTHEYSQIKGYYARLRGAGPLSGPASSWREGRERMTWQDQVWSLVGGEPGGVLIFVDLQDFSKKSTIYSKNLTKIYIYRRYAKSTIYNFFNQLFCMPIKNKKLRPYYCHVCKQVQRGGEEKMRVRLRWN